MHSFFCKRALNTKYWQSHRPKSQIHPPWKIPSLAGQVVVAMATVTCDWWINQTERTQLDWLV